MNSTTRRAFMAGTAASLSLSLSGLETAAALQPLSRRSGHHLKLSIAAYSFRQALKADPPKMTLLEGFVDFAAAQRLDAIEPTSYYFPEPVTDDYLLALKRRAFLEGLDISGTAIGNTFTLPPGAERDAEIQKTKTWIDYSATLTARTIRVFAGKVQDGSSLELARKHCIECLEETLPYAAKKGVFLALENHGGIVDTAANMLPIVQAVNHDWFGVNLDTGNFTSDDPYADIAMMAPYAVTVQVKVEINPGGRGKVPADLPRIMKIIKDSGYRGYVALEYEAEEDVLTAAPRYLAQMKDLL
jgi:sugar phosphate isomerase/epimerase